MASKSNRIIVTLSSLVIGIALVFGLTKLSHITRGPIDRIIVIFEDQIHDIEEQGIIENRTATRNEKLAWLKQYRQNINQLKNPKPILLGEFDNNAINNLKPIFSLEDSLDITFPLIHIYSAWGSEKKQRFPTKQIQDIIDLGSIPVLTWEPWLTAFVEEREPKLRALKTRDKNGLIDVSNGVYDFYLKTWAQSAKKIKTPIFLRLAHEMNDPYRYPWGPQNNEAKDFVLAWKHVHDLFKQQGVTNIIWIWAPHPAYGFFSDYYPGPEYVDFVGIGTLNYGPVVNWGKWWSFDEIFGNHYEALASFKKPIILTEFASLTYGGDRAKWYNDALRDIPTKYPLVKGILIFNFDADNTTTRQVLNWNILDDKKVLKTIKENVQKWNDSLQMK